MTRSIKIDQVSDAISAVPGGNAYVAVAQAANTIDSGAGYVQFFPDSTGSSTIVLPVTGKYLVQFNCALWGRRGAGTGAIKLVIDEGLSTEQTLGGDSRRDWWDRGNNQDTWLSQYVAEASLVAGSHTLKGYFKTTADSGLSTVGTSVVAAPSHSVFFTLISGSGLGGLIVTEKTDTADRSGTGASVTEITQLALSITTFENERVQLIFMGCVQPPSSASPQIYYCIDSGSWNICSLESAAGAWGTNGSWIITPVFTAGVHVVKFGIKCYESLNWVLKGTLVPSRTQALQYRGGQMPIKKDGALVAATEQSLNFTGPGVQLLNNAGDINISLVGTGSQRLIEPSIFSVSPDSPSVATDVRRVLGNKFYCRRSTARVLGVKYYAPGETGYTYRISLWRVSGASRITYIDVSSPTVAGVYTVYFTTPFEITVDDVMKEFMVTVYWGRAYYPVVSGGVAADGPREMGLGYSVNERPKYYGGADEFPPSSWGSSGYYKIDPIIDILPEVGAVTFPENMPILEYNSASVVNVKAAPGCDSTLRAVLSDGKEYTYTGTLTIDLTVSGRGGLDTGSEASNTWYYAYLVPNSAGTALSTIYSVTSPAIGPTGYSIFRYIGAIRNDGSSNIIKFTHTNSNVIMWAAETDIYNSDQAGYIEPEGSYTEVSLSAFVPATAISAFISSYMSLQPETPAPVWQTHWSSDGVSSGFMQTIGGDVTVAGVSEIPCEVILSSNRSIYRRRQRYTGSLNCGRTALRFRGFIDGWLAKNKQMPLLPAQYAGHEEDQPPANPSTWDDEFSGNTLNAKWTVDAGDTPGSQNSVVRNGYLAVRTRVQVSANLGIGSWVMTQAFAPVATHGKRYLVEAKIESLFTYDTQRCGVFLSDGSADYANSVWAGIGLTSGLYKAADAKIVSGVQTNFTNVAGRNARSIIAFLLDYNTDHWEFLPYVRAVDYVYSAYSANNVNPLGFTPTKVGIFMHNNVAIGAGDTYAMASVSWFRVTETTFA